MNNGLLNASGLTTPKVTTEEIILRGKPISDALTNESNVKIIAPHALGDFYFSITSHMPEGVLPLNGSEVSRVTYSDLYDYVLNIHNELVTSGKKFIISEEEWQNISIENNGYVPYYSYGSGDGLFRLPRMSGYLKATGELDEAGNYVAEGLPNITGNFNSTSLFDYVENSLTPVYNGALYYSELTDVAKPTTAGNYDSSQNGIWFDASRSNPIYGNSEHVTPETNTLFVGVWALTAFTQVGTANLSEIKEIINQSISILGDSLPLLSSRYDNKGLETSAWKLSDGSWLDGRIYTDAYNKILQRITEGDFTCLEMKESELLSTSEFPENFLIDTEGVKFRLPLFVVNERTIIKEWREEDEWYRIWSDGYLEQGGSRQVMNTDSSAILNFHIPFKNTEYTFLQTTKLNATSGNSISSVCFSERTPSSITLIQDTNTDNGGIWIASGYIDHSFIPPREEWEIDFNYYFKVSHGVDEGRINIEEKLTEFEEAAYARLDEVVEEVSKDYIVHVDKQVGELYFSFNDFYPDGVIPLDGRLVSRTTYADLWQWVQEKGLVKDDALITTNDENTVSIFNEDGTIRYCQWYGSGDGSLTFRMPKINGYLGATGDNSLAGQYIAEGLPNITGNASFSENGGFMQGSSESSTYGAFARGTKTGMGIVANATISGYMLELDASRSNPIYGNSEHVTPETNTLFVGVWAITASKAAIFDFGETAELLKQSESYLMNNVPLMSSRWDRDGLGNLGWVKADGSWVDGKTYTGAYNYCVEKLVSGHEDFIDGQVSTIGEENFDKFIVDRINKRFRLPISNGQRQLVAAYKEGTQWYNIYSDGWVEQGGEYYNNSDVNVTIELLIPFKDTTYAVDKIIGIDGVYNSSGSAPYYSTWNYTTSSFTTKTYGSAGLNRFRWFAKGYGEVLSVSSPLRTLHLYFKLAHEFYAPSQAVIQEKIDLIDNLVVKTDINLPTLSSRWDNVYAENIGWVKSEGQWLNGNTYHDAYELMVSRIGINDKFVEATVGTELTDENADKFLIDTTAVKFRLPLINGERVLVSRLMIGKNELDVAAWYNWYSDGWLEQGSQFEKNTTYTNGTTTLIKPFCSDTYQINLTASVAAATSLYGSGIITRTASSFDYSYYYNVGGIGTWNASGQSFIPSISDYNCNTYLFFKLADEVPSTIVNTQQVIDDLHEEAINFKNECSQTLAQSDFVIETFKDGTSWYRLYNSGWIEQGGEGGDAATTYSVTLHKEMADTNYSVNLTSYNYENSNYNLVCNNKTTTGFEIYGNGTGAKAVTKGWEVKGFIKTI